MAGPAPRSGTTLVVAALLVPAPAQDRSLLGPCLDGAPAHRWALPRLFREVSGLALTDDGRLLLHNDEQGFLAALDYRSGKLLGTYRLGPGTPKEDFEGIAVLGARAFMLTSRGAIFETRVPAPGPSDFGVLPYRRLLTGLGEQCEFEGLGSDPAAGVLLLACKTTHRKPLEGTLTVFRWSVSEGRPAEPEGISIPLADLARAGRGGQAFRASGVDRDPASGRWVAVAAADRAIAEFDAAGRVGAVRELPRRHRQAEGIVVTPGGELVIGDEGRGGPGTITVYACGSH